MLFEGNVDFIYNVSNLGYVYVIITKYKKSKSIIIIPLEKLVILTSDPRGPLSPRRPFGA